MLDLDVPLPKVRAVRSTGQRVAVDTFFAGTLKEGAPSKLPVTAVQTLNHEVLPFFEEQGCRVETVLSDNGREFCGRSDQHPYELFLQLEEIEHRIRLDDLQHEEATPGTMGEPYAVFEAAIPRAAKYAARSGKGRGRSRRLRSIPARSCQPNTLLVQVGHAINPIVPSTGKCPRPCRYSGGYVMETAYSTTCGYGSLTPKNR